MVRRPAQARGACGPRSPSSFILPAVLGVLFTVAVFCTKVGYTFAQVVSTSQAEGCVTTDTINMDVSSTVGASRLSLLLLECPGAEFVVDWQTAVIVNHPFRVANGTVLVVKGSSTVNVIDGNKEVQLFEVDGSGSRLSLENIELKQGQAAEGGAIWASDGVVRLVDCAVTQNKATGAGGVRWRYFFLNRPGMVGGTAVKHTTVKCY